MPNYDALEQQLCETLGLTRRPVAITFAPSPPLGVSRFSGKEPAGCSFWRLAAGGRAFYTVPGGHLNCAVGSYTHNNPPPPERARDLDLTLPFITRICYNQPSE